MNKQEALVTDGRFNFGRYESPFRIVNMLDAKSPTLLPFTKNFSLREWQAFQISTKGYFGIMAIYNTKKVCIVQFIMYDIQRKRKIRFEKKVPSWSMQVPSGLFGTTAYYKDAKHSLIVEHDINQHKLSIKVDISATKKNPAIQAQLEAYHNVEAFTPIVVCLPFSEKRAMYSHKCMMPLSGNIRLGDDTLTLLHENSNLILDDHKGYYPYTTRYDWVTAAGFLGDGRRIGFNFTDNQIINKDKYNENGIWIDGQLTFLPFTEIKRPNGYKKDWIIQDSQGKVNLTFTPVEHHAVEVNALIIQSKYQGPYGYFNGTIQSNQGLITLDNLFGMGEDFYLRS